MRNFSKFKTLFQRKKSSRIKKFARQKSFQIQKISRVEDSTVYFCGKFVGVKKFVKPQFVKVDNLFVALNFASEKFVKDKMENGKKFRKIESCKL